MSSKKIVTVRQMELLTDFMESHKDLALGRVRSKEGRALSQRLWSQISDILNAEDIGNSFRTPKDWNKFYNDYKCRLKNKVRRNNQSLNKTGGGPSDDTPLTPLEERLCAIIGPDKFETLPVQHNPVAEEIMEHDPQISVEDYIVEPTTSEDSQLQQEIINTLAERKLDGCNKQKIPHTPLVEVINTPTERPLHESKTQKTPLRAKRHKDAEVEKTKNTLINIENIKTETQKALVEVEKDKVLAIKSLADAVWAIAHALKSPKKKILKRKLLHDSEDSD